MWMAPRWRHSHRNSAVRSEEHTSELQSQSNLVCRLLLGKKNYAAEREPTRWPRALDPGCRPYLNLLVARMTCEGSCCSGFGTPRDRQTFCSLLGLPPRRL